MAEYNGKRGHGWEKRGWGGSGGFDSNIIHFEIRSSAIMCPRLKMAFLATLINSFIHWIACSPKLKLKSL